ncbi:MAG: peptidoglycan DD-metalloendopeptidase family protein [Burkholderiaceae bacterium]|nr:peptidoglycan DD-metalloendopeptidase family protein [Burkholderiaceae bacterium]
MVKSVEGVGPADAPARIGGRSVGLLVAIAAILAACASSHPAPIVHRTPTTRPAAAPAPVPPVATLPAPAPAPGAADSAPLVIETTPVPSSRVESRPLPGPGGTIAAPPPPQSSNMLKTEPMATKQPYSDSLFEELKSAAPPAAATPGPVAIAPPTAPAPAAAPTSPPAPAPAAPAAPGAASAGDFVWPATGQVVQGFAEPRSMGITIAGKAGDPIVAAADGRVIFSGPGPRGYGNLVILKHANETLSVYGHNRTLLVKEGQSVKRGQRIAELGSSGADSPQLRFEIRKDGKPVDPRKYLPAR